MDAGMTTGWEEVDAAIKLAADAIDQAIIDNRLQGESLGDVLVTLKVFLKAQWSIYTAAERDLSAHLERARQPVQNETLRRGVADGIRDYAIGIVQSINLGAAIGVAALGLCLGLAGFGLGAWWESDRMAAKVADATDTVIAAHDGFGTGLKALDATVWLDLIRMNPHITEAIHTCRLLPQADGGSACAVPLWLMLPPPKTATPATH
jgi:hypothetical protein